MCLPVAAAAAIGIAMATQAVGVIAGNQQAQAYNNAVNAQNSQRKKEIDQAATDEINKRLREMRREQSRIQVAAGEAGLSLQSGSVETLLMDSVQQAELANDVSLANRESRKLASDAEAQARMQSKTTPLGAALRIGLAGASAGLGAMNKSNAATKSGN